MGILQVLITTAVAALACIATPAQCGGSWQQFATSGEGTNNEVYALAIWDPDGAGPLPQHLVACGRFTAAAGVPGTAYVAAMDLVTRLWAPIGQGFPGIARAVAVDGSVLYVASATGVHRFAGGAWSLLPNSPAAVEVLGVMPGGDLLAGGSAGLQRWNGTTWAGLGITAGVSALTIMPNGDLVAGGAFTSTANGAANHIARWNGTSWTALGNGSSQPVHALAVDANGNLIAGGNFSGTDNVVGRWTGASWQLVVPCSGQVRALALLGNGSIAVGGHFRENHGQYGEQFLIVTGSSVVPGGVHVQNQNSMVALPAGGFAVGGWFGPSFPRFEPFNNVLLWNGAAYQAGFPPLGSLGFMERMLSRSTGEVWAVFRPDGPNAPSLRLRQLTGQGWVDLTTIVGWEVADIVELRNGDVILCGEFWGVGGVTAYCGARHSGGTWSGMGTLWNTVQRIVEMADGTLLAAHTGYAPGSRMLRWTGSAWSAQGVPVFGGIPHAAALPGGGVVFQENERNLAAPNLIQIWNGASATAQEIGRLGDKTDLLDLAVGLQGEVLVLYVGNINGVNYGRSAMWDGTAWQSLPGIHPAATRLTVAADGRWLAATGTGVVQQYSKAAAAWVNLQSPPGPLMPGRPVVLGAASNGDILLGPALNGGLWRSTADCRPTVASSPSGCVSPGGSHVLSANQAWAGGTWVATGVGLPAPAAVLQVLGMTPDTRLLSTGIASAVPGCMLLTATDEVGCELILSPTSTARLDLPLTAALGGGTFYFQMIPLGLGPSMDIQSVTATNMLTVSVGFR